MGANCSQEGQSETTICGSSPPPPPESVRPIPDDLRPKGDHAVEVAGNGTMVHVALHHPVMEEFERSSMVDGVEKAWGGPNKAPSLILGRRTRLFLQQFTKKNCGVGFRSQRYDACNPKTTIGNEVIWLTLSLFLC